MYILYARLPKMDQKKKEEKRNKREKEKWRRRKNQAKHNKALCQMLLKLYKYIMYHILEHEKQKKNENKNKIRERRVEKKPSAKTTTKICNMYFLFFLLLLSSYYTHQKLRFVCGRIGCRLFAPPSAIITCIWNWNVWRCSFLAKLKIQWQVLPPVVFHRRCGCKKKTATKCVCHWK